MAALDSLVCFSQLESYIASVYLNTEVSLPNQQTKMKNICTALKSFLSRRNFYNEKHSKVKVQFKQILRLIISQLIFTSCANDGEKMKSKASEQLIIR